MAVEHFTSDERPAALIGRDRAAEARAGARLMLHAEPGNGWAAPDFYASIASRRAWPELSQPALTLAESARLRAGELYAEASDPDGLAAELVAELRARDAIDDGPAPELCAECGHGTDGHDRRAEDGACEACWPDDPCGARAGSDADDRGALAAGEPGALWLIDPDDNATEYPGGGLHATIHAEPVQIGPESTTVAWLAVTVSTNGPDRVRAVIELGEDTARALADLMTAAVAMARDGDR